jgi:guanine deaminase
MTLYRAAVVDTPGDPFAGEPADALAADQDGGVLVRAGIILARGPFGSLHAEYPDEPVTELSGGMLLPGFVDTHVHYPQIRAIGGLGMPLLDWLERCALPEESRLADRRMRTWWPGSSWTVCWPAGRRRRWCSARISRPRWTCCSTRPRRAD